MSGWIFVDKDSEGDMRSQMRRNMRSGYRYDGGSMMHSGGGSYRDGYRYGYKHGWEDHEDERMEEDYRRMRDSRGRFV